MCLVLVPYIVYNMFSLHQVRGAVMGGAYDKHLSFRIEVPHGQQKFRELIIYIAARCRDAEFFGATKLNKILYRADFEAFRRFGEPITGAAYFRLPKGPAPKALLPVRRELEAEGAITVEYRPLGNMVQERVVPLRDAHSDLFTGDELALVDRVIEQLWDQTAEEASDASHDIVWRTRQDLDRIPYEAAYLSDEPITEEEIRRSKELARQLGWFGD